MKRESVGRHEHELGHVSAFKRFNNGPFIPSLSDSLHKDFPSSSSALLLSAWVQ